MAKMTAILSAIVAFAISGCEMKGETLGSTQGNLALMTDAADFLAATNSVLVVDFPNPGFGGSAYIENGVTIRQVDGFGVGVFSDRSPRIPGNELGVSGPESINIALPGSETIFGMYVEDSTTDPNSISVCPKSDSSFTFTFKSGGAAGVSVAVVNVDPPANQQFFVGIVADSPFDYIEVREDGAVPGENAGPHCENDYFGDIFLGGVFDSDGDGITDDVDLCPNTEIPESTVPTAGELNPNHCALMSGGPEFVCGEPRGQGQGANGTFSLEDTHGCSCEQIIEIMDLGNGHMRYGCSLGVIRDWIASN